MIVAGFAIASYLLLFKETWRKERSYAYQSALKRATAGQARPKLGKNDLSKTFNILPETPKRHLADRKPESTSILPNPKQGVIDPTHSSKPTVIADEVKLTLADVNILGSAWYVIRQRTNAVTLIATGKSISQ